VFITRFLDMRHTAPRLYMRVHRARRICSADGRQLPAAAMDGAAKLSPGCRRRPGDPDAGAWLAHLAARRRRARLLAAWTPCFLATIWMYLRLFNITPYLPINHFIVPLSFAFTLAHLSAILAGRAREAELWANNDMLTGLGNRRLLTTVMELEARQPTARYGAAIAIDLDDFKPVNDQHGHAAGDAVLVAVGERLRATFKGKGDVFRLGGDEFMILCYGTLSRMEVINLAGDYLSLNRQPVWFDNLALTIDASIGIAFREDHAGLDTMMKQADQQLYAVKQAGRGMVRIADQRTQERRKTRRSVGFLPMAAGIFFARGNDPDPAPANDMAEPERAKR
jgi:diguanylate cyclase